MERTPLLGGWDNFYVIVGSSAAALTGLQFVVTALIADRQSGTTNTFRAFGTPTVVHFCAALIVSAIASAPWHEVSSAASAFAICGILGVLYLALVILRIHRARTYQAVLEDWVFHALLPLLSYGTLLIAAITLPHRPAGSQFAVAGAALLLLLVGIHNAWDAATWIAMKKPDDSRPPG